MCVKFSSKRIPKKILLLTTSLRQMQIILQETPHILRLSLTLSQIEKKSQHGCVRWALHTVTYIHVGISPAEFMINYVIIY